MQGSAEPPTTSDFHPEVAFFCSLGLARFARSRALGHIPQPVAVGPPWQRSASLGALSRSLLATCGLAGLARFARSRALATLATSRGCRLFSVSARAILPVLPLRTCHLPECLRLQPPRHPYGSLARLSSGARSLRSLACARYARDLAGMSPGLRVRSGNSARTPSPPMPPPRMPQVTITPAPSHRIFRSRPQAVLELHVLSSGASLFRRMLSVTTAFPPHLPHVFPTSSPRLPHVPF